MTTFQGSAPQSVAWESDWTRFFTQLLQHVITLDFEVNGSWDDLDKIERRLIAGVTPRLLKALEQDDHTIKPSLIHGDLWEGNIGTTPDGNVYIFDSAAFYAHHEMEIAYWRGQYNKIKSPVYASAYWKYNDCSEPREEREDCSQLYSIYYSVIYSVNHGASGNAIRQL